MPAKIVLERLPGKRATEHRKVSGGEQHPVRPLHQSLRRMSVLGRSEKHLFH
jgi:hypothetical protein